MVAIGGWLFALSCAVLVAAGQTRPVVEQERKEFASWLLEAPLSPRRAVVVRPIGPGLTLGPADTDIPLTGVERGRLTERSGRVTIQRGADILALARGRAVALASWQLLASGPAGRAAVTVFSRELRSGRPAAWFPYDPAMAIRVVLTPPEAPRTALVLSAEGVDVEATEAGSVRVNISGTMQRLRVLRMPGASDEESELEIYFRDSTNGASTYPSGRFVALVPLPGGGYLLDLNRARNPFCAYNAVFPCPAPWSGNGFTVPVNAGEQYQEGK
jgi:hypothetical protein